MDIQKWVFLSVSLFLLSSCVTDSEPADSRVTVSSTKELGVIESPPSVSVRDGGVTAKMGDKILWLFDDTIFIPKSEDGTNARSNTAAFAPYNKPLEATEPTDENGAPYQAIPFTKEEKAFNDNEGSDDRIALWTRGLVIQDDGSGVAFVSKLKVKPGNYNYENMAVVTARFPAGKTSATRTGQLFDANEPLFVGSFKHAGYVYLYGLITVNGSKGIGVARAPAEELLHKNAYKTWDGTG